MACDWRCGPGARDAVEEGWGDTRAPHPKVSRGGAVEQDRLDVDDVLFTNRDRRDPPERCLRRACARMRRPPSLILAVRRGGTGCWSAVICEPASGPSTTAGCPVPCRRAPWSRSLSVAGRSRSISRPARPCRPRPASGPVLALLISVDHPCDVRPRLPDRGGLDRTHSPPITIWADRVDLQRTPAPVRGTGRPGHRRPRPPRR